MGRTLNLLDGLLAKARRLLELDQNRDALRLLRRLVAFAELPCSSTAEIHHLLGETHLRLSQYRAARKQLRASLRLEPENARASHRLAKAIESDPETDAARASRYYGRALELAPNDARLLADAGAYAVQMGRVRKGISLLTRAVELAPDDLEVLRSLVESLCEVERFDEARKTIRVARFRVGPSQRLDGMGSEIDFRQARLDQRRAERASSKQAAEPVVLPYLGVVSDRVHTSSGTTKFRRDAASKARPHIRRFIRHIDSGRSG